MNATTCEERQGRKGCPSRVQTVLRVSVADRYVGDILLDGQGRVWRHADPIPADVVLKAMLAQVRQGETCGSVVGRKDGRTYLWYVVGGMAELAASAEG
jgi:hypothetical protein